jgi:hypothetical protein
MPFVESGLRSSQKEDYTATGPELEAAPGLNYKMAWKTAEIEPKSNQVRGEKWRNKAQTRVSELEQNPKSEADL